MHVSGSVVDTSRATRWFVTLCFIVLLPAVALFGLLSLFGPPGWLIIVVLALVYVRPAMRIVPTIPGEAHLHREDVLRFLLGGSVPGFPRASEHELSFVIEGASTGRSLSLVLAKGDEQRLRQALSELWSTGFAQKNIGTVMTILVEEGIPGRRVAGQAAPKAPEEVEPKGFVGLAELTMWEFMLAVIGSWIALIVGIILLVRGSRKGRKIIVVSLCSTFVLGLLAVVFAFAFVR